LRRKAGIAAIIATQPSPIRCDALSKAAIRSFAAKQKPIVANPSYAAYTWVSVGVEVLISRAPLL
jgi:hypothetical protein